MAKHINVKVDDEEYQELSNLKEKHGLTWYGLLIAGGRYVDEEF